jgi:hypothetical protein
VGTLVFAEVAAIRAREVAEAAFVRFLALMQRGDVGLQLSVRGSCVTAAVTHIRTFASVCAFVIVFCLVGGECLGATRKTAGVGTVAGVAKEMAREFGALLEVLCGSVTAFPQAETGGAVVDVYVFGVLVQGFGGGENLETEDTWSMLPRDFVSCLGDCRA